MLKLVIGDYNYSSWSLPPWFAAKQVDIPFEEITIRLDKPRFSHAFRYSPAGTLPCLIDDGLVLWNSLAICEYLAELKPSLWPADRRERAEARCICMEAHSSFHALRQAMPMNIRVFSPFGSYSAELKADIERVIAIFESCRERFARRGPFLFGAFSIADAMYAAVVWRFLTYSVEVPEASSAWMRTMQNQLAMLDWKNRALAEK